MKGSEHAQLDPWVSDSLPVTHHSWCPAEPPALRMSTRYWYLPKKVPYWLSLALVAFVNYSICLVTYSQPCWQVAQAQPTVPMKTAMWIKGKLWTMDQIQHMAWFCQWSFIGTQSWPFTYALSMAAFLPQYSWVVVTDSMAHKPKNIYYFILYRKRLLSPDKKADIQAHKDLNKYIITIVIIIQC